MRLHLSWIERLLIFEASKGKHKVYTLNSSICKAAPDRIDKIEIDPSLPPYLSPARSLSPRPRFGLLLQNDGSPRVVAVINNCQFAHFMGVQCTLYIPSGCFQ